MLIQSHSQKKREPEDHADSEPQPEEREPQDGYVVSGPEPVERAPGDQSEKKEAQNDDDRNSEQIDDIERANQRRSPPLSQGRSFSKQFAELWNSTGEAYERVFSDTARAASANAEGNVAETLGKGGAAIRKDDELSAKIARLSKICQEGGAVIRASQSEDKDDDHHAGTSTKSWASIDSEDSKEEFESYQSQKEVEFIRRKNANFARREKSAEERKAEFDEDMKKEIEIFKQKKMMAEAKDKIAKQRAKDKKKKMIAEAKDKIAKQRAKDQKKKAAVKKKAAPKKKNTTKKNYIKTCEETNAHLLRIRR